jgi:hypothetical protein
MIIKRRIRLTLALKQGTQTYPRCDQESLIEYSQQVPGSRKQVLKHTDHISRMKVLASKLPEK